MHDTDILHSDSSRNVMASLAIYYPNNIIAHIFVLSSAIKFLINIIIDTNFIHSDAMCSCIDHNFIWTIIRIMAYSNYSVYVFLI